MFMIAFVSLGYLFASRKLYVLKNLYQFIYSYVMALAVGGEKPNFSMIWHDKKTENEEAKNTK